MNILVKLGAGLRGRISGHNRGELQLSLPAGRSVYQALDRLGLDLKQVRTIMVNGRPLKQDRPLQAGDRLALLPAECGAIHEITIFFSHQPPFLAPIK